MPMDAATHAMFLQFMEAQKNRRQPGNAEVPEPIQAQRPIVRAPLRQIEAAIDPDRERADQDMEDQGARSQNKAPNIPAVMKSRATLKREAEQKRLDLDVGLDSFSPELQEKMRAMKELIDKPHI